jgi:hypothetical protein
VINSPNIAEFDNDKGTVIRHQYDPKKILEQLGCASSYDDY